MILSSFVQNKYNSKKSNRKATKELLLQLGNIENTLNRVIHVAGTNGKGSVVATLQAILQEHGYSVNTFTSPHLININERIKHNDIEIPDNDLNSIHSELLHTYPLYDKLSFFEAIFVIAVVYFNKCKADFNIIETGVGGTRDITNVIQNKELSIITKIGLDHQKYLGNDILSIAIEKLGIAQNTKNLSIANQSKEVNELFVSTLAGNNTLNVAYYLDSYYHRGNVLYTHGKVIKLDNLSLSGEHQKDNISVAINGLFMLLDINLDTELIKNSLAKIKHNGRLQNLGSKIHRIDLGRNSACLIDGAHNILGLKSALEYLLSNYPKLTKYILLNIHHTKSITQFVDIIIKFIPLENIILVGSNSSELYSYSDIARYYYNGQIKLNSAVNFKEALYIINQTAPQDKVILVTGSLYLCGNILQNLNPV